MVLLLALFLAMPQDYMNLLMERNYEEALAYCDEMITREEASRGCFLPWVSKEKKIMAWKTEKGDIYLDKLNELDKAIETYQNIIDSYNQRDGWVYYRLAQAFEKKEDFLNAARAYEIVATQYRTPPLDSFALNGVERCFKKNYQDFVATVDGYNITRLELDERLTKTSRWGGKDEQDILDQMIMERIILTTAYDYGADTTDFFNQAMRVKKRSLLLDEVRETDVIAKAVPTEKELKNYYKEHKEEFKLREEVRGKEIIVESDSLAQILLDSLRKDIASFDTLAKLYSTAPTSRSGGNIGVVYRETKPEPIERALFSAEVNTLTDIVPHDNKFGIYLITEHKPERYSTYQEVTDRLDAAVRSEKLVSNENELMERLRADREIIILEEPQGDTVATIDGRPIPRRHVEMTSELRRQFGQVDLSNPDEFRDMLEKTIEDELKLEWAERQKYFLNDSYFTRAQEARHDIMSRSLYQKVVVEGVDVDSQEVRAYYNEHKEDYKIPESVQCRELVVTSKNLATDLRAMLLNNPAAFDSLAKEHSIASSKMRGGQTGLIRRGMKPEPYETIAFTLKVGSISKVFSVDDSTYTIITVEEHNPETYRTFEEMASRIESALLRQRQGNIASEFLTQIKEEADIQIYLEPTTSEPEEQEEEVDVEKKE
jgi:parvulin-like peptidyl-prolyl isomerase